MRHASAANSSAARSSDAAAADDARLELEDSRGKWGLAHPLLTSIAIVTVVHACIPFGLSVSDVVGGVDTLLEQGGCTQQVDALLAEARRHIIDGVITAAVAIVIACGVLGVSCWQALLTSHMLHMLDAVTSAGAVAAMVATLMLTYRASGILLGIAPGVLGGMCHTPQLEIPGTTRLVNASWVMLAAFEAKLIMTLVYLARAPSDQVAPEDPLSIEAMEAVVVDRLPPAGRILAAGGQPTPTAADWKHAVLTAVRVDHVDVSDRDRLVPRAMVVAEEIQPHGARV